MSSITIATCLYDIRRREQTIAEEEEKDLRRLEQYIELGKSMLSIKLPMVIYTDSEEIRDRLLEIRAGYGMEDKTVIVELPFEETFFYKDIGVLEERMKEHKLKNLNATKDTPLYVMLNNNKFDFLERTIASNPFESLYFMWLDLGVQHCAKATEEEWARVAEEWPPLIVENKTQIHQLCIHTVTKNPSQSWKDYFRMIYHHRGGGLFGGHCDQILKYSGRFKALWSKILHEEKWWQLDEALMTIITEEHPEDFRFFYGDYDGMITNFNESRRSWDLVFQTTQRHLDARKYVLSEHVLCTLDHVMQALPGNDQRYLRYLRMRICNDYYKWSGMFSEPLRAILTDSKRMAEIPRHFIQHEMNNLRFYHEKTAMEFMARWSFLDERNSVAVERWKSSIQKDDQWISLNKNHGPWTDLEIPIMEDVEYNPLLAHFRDRMITIQGQSSEMDIRVRKLYGFMELVKERVVFVVMARSEKKISDPYDDLNETCGYIERNYPGLDFHLLFLNATPFEIAKTRQQEASKRLIVFHLYLPFQYNNKEKNEALMEGLAQWREQGIVLCHEH